jgi:cohesin complex subunit SA-1/2
MVVLKKLISIDYTALFITNFAPISDFHLPVLGQVCAILSDLWSLFSKAKLTGTTLEALGFCPSTNLLKSFWKLCEYRLTFPEETEEEVTDGPHSSEYLNEKDAILSSAAKLIAHGMVPKDYLGPEVVSHYVLHGKIVAETVKQLLVQVKKHSKLEEISYLYFNSMKRVEHLSPSLHQDFFLKTLFID